MDESISPELSKLIQESISQQVAMIKQEMKIEMEQEISK